MPAVLVDVGHHLLEPNSSGQTISLSVVSTSPSDSPVAGFELRAQIVSSKAGPYFESVRFAGDFWNTYPHIEIGNPLPSDRKLALGDVAFTQGFEARTDGTLVTFTVDTTGIPAGSYQFRLTGTQVGNSGFRRTDGASVSSVIRSGTIQVRSIAQNQDHPSDVNGDGLISPLDALLLLNELSNNGSYEIQMPSSEEPPYFDVDGDGHTSPKDALGVINCLNGLSCVTTPAPILANVTPDFQFDPPDSTGVGDPDAPNEDDPTHPADCVYDSLDEDGIPFPIFDPEVCSDFIQHARKGSDEQSAGTASVAPAEGTEEFPASSLVPSQAASLPASFDPAASLKANPVDAVIVDISDELSIDETSEDLVALGLDGFVDNT